MRFYTQTHQHFCGIDLHTKTMFLCILDSSGEIVLHTNIPVRPRPFLKAIKPFRDDLVIGVECMFPWYWLADLCIQEKIKFILGHALYMTKSSGTILNRFSEPEGENIGICFLALFMAAKPRAIKSIRKKSPD